MTQRFVMDPSSDRGVYSLLTALVTPRPIAWVSTTSAAGVDNLAPHSFYQIVSTSPPIVMISTIGEKDTARNVRATSEFVVCGAPTRLIREINLTAVEFAGDVSEFEAVGLTREASERVGPPRVAESPYALECVSTEIQSVGNGTVIFGEVVYVAVDMEVVDGGRVRIERLDPVARLGGSQWSTVGEIVELPRVDLQQHVDCWNPPVKLVGKGRPHGWADSAVDTDSARDIVEHAVTEQV